LLCEAFDLDFTRAKGVFFREPMFEVERKWAYFRAGRMESILTTVPLRFGWGRAIGIAGVATRHASRGQGFASELLRETLRCAEEAGEGSALLFARQTELYQSVGFEVLDEVIRAPVMSNHEPDVPPVLSVDEVVTHYNRWASQNPHRLQRDERRWDYWKWNLRVCSPFSAGYICIEGNLLRECIAYQPPKDWALHPSTEWIGLRSMAKSIGVPIGPAQSELFLMGRAFEQVPQMFMTDQF